MQMNITRQVTSGMITFVAASAAKSALACPVCFGALEGPVADGVNKAILALLGITGGVLVCFAAFFVYLYKQSRSNAVEPPSQTAAEDTAGHVMEGTAS